NSKADSDRFPDFHRGSRLSVKFGDQLSGGSPLHRVGGAHLGADQDSVNSVFALLFQDFTRD
ncbi:hypothetical protein, partial [Aurantiacibacter suaedae]|uniref:hypothetical protein n=1 Tax=Aurantiacibacter suaedae TaxID=2545755 RepID=UPI0019D67FB1